MQILSLRAIVALAVLAMLFAACSASADVAVDAASADGAEPSVPTAAPVAPTVEPAVPTAEPAAPTETPAVEPTAVGAAPTEAPVEEVSACALVSDDTIATFAEAAVTSSDDGTVAGVASCLYDFESERRVQVISIPATLWAQQIPSALDQVEQSGMLNDPVTAEKFDAARVLIAEGGADTPAGACELFSLMVELQGVGPGQTEVVNFVPNSVAPLTVTGQRCSDGNFSSVTLSADGLVDDDATFDRVVAALDAVHDAGTG